MLLVYCLPYVILHLFVDLYTMLFSLFYTICYFCVNLFTRTIPNVKKCASKVSDESHQLDLKVFLFIDNSIFQSHKYSSFECPPVSLYLYS